MGPWLKKIKGPGQWLCLPTLKADAYLSIPSLSLHFPDTTFQNRLLAHLFFTFHLNYSSFSFIMQPRTSFHMGERKIDRDQQLECKFSRLKLNYQFRKSPYVLVCFTMDIGGGLKIFFDFFIITLTSLFLIKQKKSSTP